MTKQKRRTGGDGIDSVADYRHESTKRKNIPPAKLAAEGTVPVLPKIEYGYSPRRPPALRFDSHGDADKLPELLAEAKKRKLTDEEVRILAEALRTQEPWLEWSGKRELPGFAVDPVALHIHERVSTQAILKIAARQDVERTLFGDPEQEYHEAVQFYRHDIDWTNRLILGDSLQVMASLAKREDLAGKVQVIYIDPPYGIKFASNFQPEVGKRDVKDKEADLTREAEMVKAYRDTWHLGIHSYLSYLRDRLIVARELLADTGSIFVQISNENAQRIRMILDEVFGAESFVSEIAYVTTGGRSSLLLPNVFDRVMWYSRNIAKIKYRQLYVERELRDGGGWAHSRIEREDGVRENLGVEKVRQLLANDGNVRPYMMDQIVSQGATTTGSSPIEFNGRRFTLPHNSHWKTSTQGMERLARAARIEASENSIRYVRFFDDFSVQPVSNVWNDTNRAGYLDEKRYVVQTAAEVIKRCMLMTTDPGDLVLDPTCGSGTTAFVAEQWGRRWITIDTSRVAVAIARQRILTAKYDYYKLYDDNAGVAGSFVYKTVPHITLKSIAQNQNLDPIFTKYEPILDAKLRACNAALAKVTKEDRQKLELKLLDKERRDGKRAVTDADRRRWSLPDKGKMWEHWTVSLDTDPAWPKELQSAVMEYRQAWRAKMDEVNACIAANAEQEELVDQPVIERGKSRVSGPFTVEAVQPPELSMGDVIAEFDGAPGELEGHFVVRGVTKTNEFEVKNVEAYLDEMTRLLKLDGVRFPNNKEMAFSRLQRLADSSGLHAEGRWTNKGETDPDPEGEATVGVVFGPQYGPFTVQMLEKLIRPAKRRYEALVIAAFNFAAEVQDLAENHDVPNFRIHIAHIRPDVNPGMSGLLKEKPGSQLFTVFGQPRTRLEKSSNEYIVHMEGVDIYDPVNNVIRSTEDSKVAAWFLDGDYDGRTFCITQAFFPDKSAWEKLAKALNGKDGPIDGKRFEALSGTVSLPFPVGKHKFAAVKVIDPRGNEVMQVHRLEGTR